MRISDWSSDVCSSDLAVTTRSTRTVTVAAIATGRVVLLFLADLGEVEALALVDPGLDADDSVGGLGLGEAVIDVGAQRSEERRVGNECVSTCRSRWSPLNQTKNKSNQKQKNQQ